jgi:hypothetical protein
MKALRRIHDALKASVGIKEALTKHSLAMHQGLDEIRSAIAELNQEKQRVEKLLRPREEVEADLRWWIQKHGRLAQSTSLQLVSAPTFRPRENREHASNLYRDLHSMTQRHGVLPTLCAMVPAQVLVYLTQTFDADYAANESISDHDRAERLRELDEQILELSLVEEAAIRSLLEKGFQVTRRTDVDPRAALADASELPG